MKDLNQIDAAIEELIANKEIFTIQPDGGELLTDKAGGNKILEIRAGQPYGDLSLPAMARNGRVETVRVSKRDQYYVVNSVKKVHINPRPSRPRKSAMLGYKGGRKGGYSPEKYQEVYSYFSKRALGIRDESDGTTYSNRKISVLTGVSNQSINIWFANLVIQVKRDLLNGITPSHVAKTYNIDEQAIPVIIGKQTPRNSNRPKRQV